MFDDPADEAVDDVSPNPTEEQAHAAAKAKAVDDTATSPDRRVIDPEEARNTNFSPSVVFGILADERQQYALYYLTDHGGTAILEKIAKHLAAWENRTTVELATAEMSNRVYAGLHHADLPKLEDYGFIEFDRETGTVTLTEHGEQIDSSLEFAKQRKTNEYLGAPGQDSLGSSQTGTHSEEDHDHDN
ncbi:MULTISPECIES: DUF7344 domain-containing protein [Natrialbaceae]|uniref:DUF7344 domain-containing protein n=1 Tax=Natrialbaceae TaxID=1644061 RepID=UPI00207C3297|nr:hypothetical protein [Natronococcus sp. CG52]